MNKGTYDYIETQERWRWRGYYKDAVSGQMKRKHIYAKNKKVLREKVERWQLELEGGEAGKELKLADWVNMWIDTVKPSIKTRTWEAYQYALNGHIVPKFGGLKLGQVNAKSFQEYFNDLLKKYSVSTVSTIRRYTIMCLEAAVRYGYITNNPVRATRPPRKVKKEIIALSTTQTEAIITIANEGKYQVNPHQDEGAEYLRRCYYALIVTAIDSGMRQGELLGLKWADISNGIITVHNNLVYSLSGKKLDTPKTKTSARRVIMTERNRTVLEQWQKTQKEYSNRFYGLYLNEGGRVFTNATGNYVDAHNFLRRCWRPICARLGLEGVTFHSLRHAHASQLLAGGVSPQIVMQRLGHSSLDVTLRVYAHLLPNAQEAAMPEINKIYGEFKGVR